MRRVALPRVVRLQLQKERSMKSLYALPLVLLLAATTNASAQDVRYNFDKDANFPSFKTYKWVALKDAPKLNDLVDKQIKETVDAELAKKGLTKSDSDTADLYIGYQAGVGTEKQYTSFDSGWGYGPGWGRGYYGAGGGMTTGTTSTIYGGQLARGARQPRPSMRMPNPRNSRRT
jgi:hypothetical protein